MQQPVCDRDDLLTPHTITDLLQRCARTGGVWDDSDNLVHSGGTCIAPSEASRKVSCAC